MSERSLDAAALQGNSHRLPPDTDCMPRTVTGWGSDSAPGQPGSAAKLQPSKASWIHLLLVKFLLV